MDNKELKEKIKEQGLDGLEEVVKCAVEESYDLIKVIIEATGNKMLIGLLGMIMMSKGFILEFVDKINGKEG